MRRTLGPLALIACATVTLVTLAAAAGPQRRRAPLPPARAASTHAPYAAGECRPCHARGDAKNPGPARRDDRLCFDCHDDYKAGRQGGRHPATKAMCTSCHNPHNATGKKLLD